MTLRNDDADHPTPAPMRLVRIGLHSQGEPLALMRTDCHVCRSEGLHARARQHDARLRGVAVAVAGLGPVPFKHGEFGAVKPPALAVPEDMAKLINFGHAGHHELFHGKFGAGMQIKVPFMLQARIQNFGLEGMDMGVHDRADL